MTNNLGIKKPSLILSTPPFDSCRISGAIGLTVIVYYNGLKVMVYLINKELRAIYAYLRRNYREIVVFICATFCLTLHNYHVIWNPWLSSLIYYAVIPFLVILIILRRNPMDFGLRSGNSRLWGFYILVTCLVSLPILYIASHNQGLRDYYMIADLNLSVYLLETIIRLLASEFILRGFLLFGLKDKMKEGSILIQMVPFVLIHFGKPEIETLSTILTGIYFGYVAYRGNSFWPAFIIHLFINISFTLLVNHS
jgi:membrane protease YdiL (CAAX protease family)